MFLFAGSLLLAACGDRPDDALSESETVSLIADLQLADAYVRQEGVHYGSDEWRCRMSDSIMARHGVTKAQFDTTLAYYGRNFDLYYKLMEKVESRLHDREKKYLASTSDIDENSTDIWPYPAHAVFSALSDVDGLVFSFPDVGISSGESLEWSLRFTSDVTGQFMLGVDYDDGSSSYEAREIHSSRHPRLQLQTDTVLKVRRIYGYFRPDATCRLPLFADSIRLLHVPYDEDRYSSIHRLRQIRKATRYDAAKARAEADSVSRARRDSVSSDTADSAARRSDRARVPQTSEKRKNRQRPNGFTPFTKSAR